MYPQKFHQGSAACVYLFWVNSSICCHPVIFEPLPKMFPVSPLRADLYIFLYYCHAIGLWYQTSWGVSYGICGIALLCISHALLYNL